MLLQHVTLLRWGGFRGRLFASRLFDIIVQKWKSLCYVILAAWRCTWLLNHRRDLTCIRSSFSVPFSNVNGNTVAEESRLFFIPERVDLISLTISSQTLMHYTVGQQFIARPRMQVMRVCDREKQLPFEIWINVLMSAWHLFCAHTGTYLSFLFFAYVVTYS